MDAPNVLIASRTVMFALFGGHKRAQGDAEEVEGTVILYCFAFERSLRIFECDTTLGKRICESFIREERFVRIR